MKDGNNIEEDFCNFLWDSPLLYSCLIQRRIIQLKFKEKLIYRWLVRLTMEQSLRGRVKLWSDGTWRGIRGAPTSLSNTMNSLFDGVERPEDLSTNRAFMRVRMFCQRLDPLLPMPDNISSGIGTSRTVSNPSSLSKLGHNFLMVNFLKEC